MDPETRRYIVAAHQRELRAEAAAERLAAQARRERDQESASGRPSPAAMRAPWRVTLFNRVRRLLTPHARWGASRRRRYLLP